MSEKEKRDVKPQDVETTETNRDEMDSAQFSPDPSQAESKRKDTGKAKSYNEPPNQEAENDENNQQKEEKNGLRDYPQLTGDEDSVEKQESDHSYQDNVNTGPVTPDPDSDQ